MSNKQYKLKMIICLGRYNIQQIVFQKINNKLLIFTVILVDYIN